MSEVIDVVLPVFGLIGIGYLVAWFGVLSVKTGEAIGDFVFVIAIPLFIFKTLATADFPAVSPWALWLSYFAGVAVVWIAADLATRKIFGRDGRAGVVAGVSAGFSNLVLVGIPMVHATFGEAGTIPLFILISVHLPIMMLVSTLLIVRHQDADAAPKRAVDVARTILGNLLKNPIIMGILAGVAWRFTGLEITGVPRSLIDQLAMTATPCALFTLGMGLRRYGIGGNVAPAIVLSILKIIVMPAAVWLIVTTFTDLPALWVAVATVAAACPSGVNAYLIANHFRTGHALSSNTITLTTAAAVVTMSVVLTLLS